MRIARPDRTGDGGELGIVDQERGERGGMMQPLGEPLRRGRSEPPVPISMSASISPLNRTSAGTSSSVARRARTMCPPSMPGPEPEAGWSTREGS
ncbi:hypothetical protein [Streptomyces sp. NPDC058092]|uniref:hypothetical protein n=1 Tax=Streptomyces sp. NPDC058092 TaxID=3346336 RepID=UPI0036EC488E